MVVGVGVERREIVAGLRHAIFGGVELAGERNVEEAIAFVGGGVVGV